MSLCRIVVCCLGVYGKGVFVVVLIKVGECVVEYKGE